MKFICSACLVLAGVLQFSPTEGAPPVSPLTVINDDVGEADRTLSEFAGSMVALHFVEPSAPRSDVEAWMGTIHRQAPSRAGLKQVIVFHDDKTEDLAQLASKCAGPLVVIARDKGGALAHELDLTPDQGDHLSAPPSTVVLGADGEELFRRVGGDSTDFMSWPDIVQRIDASTGVVAAGHYNLPKGGTLAVDGYDVVSYFKGGQAQRGRKEFSSRYRGIDYHFASREHRTEFASSPERYVPTFGGWCASAMGAKGTKVEIDPTNFKVTNGRLFLFYKGTFSDALKDWNKHEAEWLPKADANWEQISGETATHRP